MNLLCHLCRQDSGTLLVHAECAKNLSVSQRATLDKLWHEEVCKRDNWTCTYCGAQFDPDSEEQRQMVCGDHIETKGSMPGSRWDIANGRCTDLTCHNQRHAGKLNQNKTMRENIKEKQEEKKSRSKKSAICTVKGCVLFGYLNGYCCRHAK